MISKFKLINKSFIIFYINYDYLYYFLFYYLDYLN